MPGYGIKRGNKFLAWFGKDGPRIFVPLHISYPIIFYSAYEVDNFLQHLMSTTNDYSLTVHQFSDEELEEFTVRKLRGH
jgi:hypothetical protein